MKILFLDVDGTLNHTSWYISDEYQKLGPSEELDLDPRCIERINTVCKETGCKIVISSDWRRDANWKQRLEKAGLENIVDCTPITLFGQFGSTYHFSRGEEIQMWLEWHPEVKNYIIVDDATDMLREQIPYYIHVDPMYGFTDHDAIKAIHFLKK